MPIRLNNLREILVSTLILTCFMNVSHAQGSLTPPGVPAPTMKTLDQVEARIPIKTADLPLTISAPGSYYLTENINFTVLDTSGISILSNDVSIDLNGYSLTGPGKTAGVSGSGIFGQPGRSGISIANGSVRGWRDNGILLQEGFFSEFEYAQINKVFTFDNGGDGISVAGKSIVSNCTARFNEGRGIAVYAWSIVSDCIAADNTGAGIDAGRDNIVRNCMVNAGNSIGIISTSSSTIENNSVFFTGGHGIEVGSNCQVLNNIVRDAGNNIFIPITSDAAAIRATGDLNRIEGNHLMNSRWGLQVTGSRNLIVNNSVGNNIDNFGSINSNNSIGPIVTSGTITTNNNPHANYEL